MEKVKEDQGRYSFNFSWLWYIPIIIALGIVPLMIRLTMVDVKELEYMQLFNQTQIPDIFSQYKAGALMAIVATMLIMLFLKFNKKDLKKDIYFKLTGVGVLLYAGFTLLSASFSQYSDLAWWGVPDRAEGAVLLMGYLVLMYYTYYIVQKKEDVKFVIAPLVILSGIVAFIGIFQYIGQDLLLTTDLGNRLIVPEAYAQYRGNLSGMYESGKIYGTMYHYNYVGSFGAIIVPLFLTLVFFIPNVKYKLVFGFASFCSIILLLGSTSRAGLIGLVVSILLFVVIFVKRIIKRWKIVVPIILALGIVIVGLNSMLGGTLFERIPSLIQDAFLIVQDQEEYVDYKQTLPIQGIENKEDHVVLKTAQGDLIIRSGGQELADDQTLVFEDSEGKEVEAVLNGEKYSFSDPRFAGITIDERSELAEEVSKWLVEYGGNRVFYIGVESSRVYYVNPITYQEEEWQEPERIGFYGKERLGSARGYIWARSLPLLKETLLLGYGPDTYALHFPQDDYLGKWYAYGTTSIVVDKPHNLYLQIALNQGVIALIGFLILVGAYIVRSMKLYAFREGYSRFDIMGIAILLGIVGYLGAGVFNDSVVSVAPIFWILLGAGMAINFLIGKERREYEKALAHATIDIKKRKHIN